MISDESSTRLYEGFNIQTGQKVALKFPKFGCNQTIAELKILPQLSHNRIIRLNDVIMTEDGPCLVFPYALGGDLYGLLANGGVSEADTGCIIYHLLESLDYLHEQNIWHRDVKPENILITAKEFDPHVIVLNDFGYCHRFEEQWCNSPCGSPFYSAPELHLGQPYNEKVDIWALGVTMFACLTNRLPFDVSNPRQGLYAVMDGLPNLERLPCLKGFSVEGKDLLRKMLTKDIGKRISAKAALEHEWFDVIRNAHEPDATVCPCCKAALDCAF
jgi:serine/threonine protein kinase